jgi:hypothetical protein
MLQKVLNDTPPVSAGGAGWLWWLDIDTVLDPAQVCSAQSGPCADCATSALLRADVLEQNPPRREGLLRRGWDALQTLPLEQYGGHDIVLWGERELVEAGDIQGAGSGAHCTARMQHLAVSLLCPKAVFTAIQYVTLCRGSALLPPVHHSDT